MEDEGEWLKIQQADAWHVPDQSLALGRFEGGNVGKLHLKGKYGMAWETGGVQPGKVLTFNMTFLMRLATDS